MTPLRHYAVRSSPIIAHVYPTALGDAFRGGFMLFLQRRLRETGSVWR